MSRGSTRSTLFPYTTLFRSRRGLRRASGSSSAWSRARSWCRAAPSRSGRSEEHTSELQSLTNLVCRLLLEKINSQADSIDQPAAAGRPRDALVDLVQSQDAG